MEMNKLFRNKAFYLGFFIGILVIIILNLYTIYLRTGCHHCAFWFGFPLPFYVSYITNCETENISFGCYTGEISWFGTVANILFTAIFCLVTGLVFKFVWSKISRRGGAELK
jgi:hypothetical protein